MEGILVIIIVVILCHFCLYLNIKKRLDEIERKNSSPVMPEVNIHCTPQPCVVQAPPPQVSITPTPPNEEELAVVTMAAITAYESDIASQTGAFGAYSPDQTPARIHEAARRMQKEQNQRWVATARYENHKRL